MQISLDEVSRLLRTQPTSRLGSSWVNGTNPTELTSETTPASRVEVSAQAQEVRRVTKLVNEMPETREDRVQALKAQIESGSYQVSGEEIADLIIRRAFADGAR